MTDLQLAHWIALIALVLFAALLSIHFDLNRKFTRLRQRSWKEQWSLEEENRRLRARLKKSGA